MKAAMATQKKKEATEAKKAMKKKAATKAVQKKAAMKVRTKKAAMKTMKQEKKTSLPTWLGGRAYGTAHLRNRLYFNGSISNY